MKFSQLADYFEKLEATAKRNEMVALLAELFKSLSPEEINKVSYLCQERLVPNYEKIEFGMSEKLIARSLSKALGKDENEIWSLYKEMGDLGLLAQEYIKTKGDVLEILEVYNRLLDIATTAGKGSVEKKTDELAKLFSLASGKEAKYISRIVLGRLRLGIGDPTVLDAFSYAYCGDKSLRPVIERAYNLCSDLGLVGYTLFSKGLDAIKDFKVQVGKPIRMALAERLPTAEDIIAKIGRCSVEPKFDGFRCQIHKDGKDIKIFSRNLEDNTEMFPDLVDGARKQINSEKAIIEGEALAFNEEAQEFYPFQVTVQRKRKYQIETMMIDLPLKLFAFDLLYLDGEDYTSRPYIERKEKLGKLILPGNVIMVADYIITDDPKELDAFFENAIGSGLEGIVAKRLDAPYQAGARNFNWIKLKRSYKGELTDTVDLVILGYYVGRGARAKFGIGSLLAGVYDSETDTFKTIAKIGSGLTEDEWVKMKNILDEIKVDKKPSRVISVLEPDVWVEPRYVVEVRADEITRSPVHTAGKDEGELGYALRFPRVERFIRVDRVPEDATTVKEIQEMYDMQKKVEVKE
ncbi:MAG TPA: ATP-dependent DNA ligase [bacterium]|nr:ATP-dependent DNA ligase [Dictyoglomota bacterium]HHV81566.1 ATP-dependent DNA ligase [bacterium]HOK29797.1 ATP-dependent DNA ligase [bacterium]HRR90962.1 ATP-dependent DNA ligase [bacterium]